jgi:hypothetical protein
LLLSFLSTTLFGLFIRDVPGIAVLLGVFVATLVNHACLIEMIEDMSLSTKRGGAPLDKFKMIQLGFVKLIVLVGALSLGVLFIGSRIILPLLNYVVIIFILGTSLKTRTS